jgi:hypothetical protein
MLLMTIEEMRLAFEDLLCSHGGNLRVWPDDVRPTLLRYLRQSFDARRRIMEMRRMESILSDDMDDVAPPIDLEDRIMGAMFDLMAREKSTLAKQKRHVDFTAPLK